PSYYYTLSLHDALPISIGFEPMHKGFADLSLATWVRRRRTSILREFTWCRQSQKQAQRIRRRGRRQRATFGFLGQGKSSDRDSQDRKSTRLNSSHVSIS